jgi:hypothetical protein
VRSRSSQFPAQGPAHRAAQHPDAQRWDEQATVFPLRL